MSSWDKPKKLLDPGHIIYQFMSRLVFLVSLVISSLVSASSSFSGLPRPVAVSAASSATFSGLVRPAALIKRSISRCLDLADMSMFDDSPVSTRYSHDYDAGYHQTEALSGLVGDMDAFVDDEDDFYSIYADENDENTPPSFASARFSPFLPQQETDFDSFVEPDCPTILEPQEQEQEKIKELEHIPRFALPPRARVSPGTSSFLLLNLRKDIGDLDQVRSKSRSNN